MPGFQSIVGQEKAIRFLTILLHKGTIPNALLFTGPEGVGKKTAALSFAMAAGCAGMNESKNKSSGYNFETPSFPTESCGTCRYCRKFIAGTHPDFIRIDPEGQVTKIAQIRELRRIITMKPYEARLRAVVITEAHTLNREASNAMLKVVEEPPDRTIFILITTAISDLLPTIVSRCRQVRFRPVPVKLLAHALVQDHALNPKEAELMANMADGSFTRASALKNSRWIFRRNRIISETEKIISGSVSTLLAFAEKLAKNNDKSAIQDLLSIMITWHRDLVVAKYCPDKTINKDLMEHVRKFSQRYHQDMIFKRIFAVHQAQKDMDANVNPRLVLENLFLTLAETTRDTK